MRNNVVGVLKSYVHKIQLLAVSKRNRNFLNNPLDLESGLFSTSLNKCSSQRTHRIEMDLFVVEQSISTALYESINARQSQIFTLSWHVSSTWIKETFEKRRGFVKNCNVRLKRMASARMTWRWTANDRKTNTWTLTGVKYFILCSSETSEFHYEPRDSLTTQQYIQLWRYSINKHPRYCRNYF